MTKYWKVGEIADLTGLTIRTLRYYDQIRLFSPSAYTSAGHRRYTRGDLERLQMIVMLKQMGIALEDIREIVQGGKNSILKIMDQQMDRLREDIQIQQQLLHELEKTKMELPNKNHLSFDELKTLFALMKTNRSRYFSDSQLEEMKRYYEQKNEETLEKDTQAFQTLLIQLQQNKDSGIPANTKAVTELAIKWENIVYAFSNDDPEFEKNTESFHSNNPNNPLQFGMNEELYRYIREALKHATRKST